MSTDEEIILQYGFRSIINRKLQSWNGFTALLFSDNGEREEFDLVDGSKSTSTQFKDKNSLESAYFGRSIERTIFRFPKPTLLQGKLEMIKDQLHEFFTRTKENILSDPIFIVNEIGTDSISGYYIWQCR